MYFSEPKANLLKSFYDDPSKGIYIRELERSSGMSYERVHHYLKELESDGVLVASNRGKIKEYKINHSHSLAEKAFSMIELMRRREFFDKNKGFEADIQNLKDKLVDSIGDPIKSILLNPMFSGKKIKEIELLLITHSIDTLFYNRVAAICKQCGTDSIVFVVYIDPVSDFRNKFLSDAEYKQKWKKSIVLFGEESYWGDMLRKKLYML